MKAWLNGRLLEAGEAALSLGDRGFTLGDGLFETLRVADGLPRHRDRHLDRLARGAALLGIAVPPRAMLERALADTLSANGGDVGVLRLTLTRGAGRRGIEIEPDAVPTLAVTAAPAGSPPGPARLIVSRSYRRDEGSPLSGVKTLAYLPSVLARAEARRAGADDALLPNTAGRIACGTVGNVFALVGGRLVTPPLSEGALPGIARGLVLEAGLAEEAPLPPIALAGTEALILSNSLALRPVAMLEGRALDPAVAADLLARLAAVT